MEDLLFPTWVTSSPAMALVDVYSQHIYRQERDDGSQQPVTTSSTHLVRVAATHTRVRVDILNDAVVQSLLRLSHINELASGQSDEVNAKNASALVAILALAVECRHLPSDLTKGFYTECSSLYASLLPRLPQLRYAAGVEVESFVASLVACGLKLRNYADVDGTAASKHHVGLAGFDYRITDPLILSCIMEDLNRCVGDPISLGALEGLAYTRSRRPVLLGGALLDRLHQLIGAYSTSPRRKDLPYQKLLCLLLEAVSCSKTIDYDKTNNWVTAIIQESYLIRGLFQREILHSRVVGATLTLLVRKFQELAAAYRQRSATGSLDGFPDLTEGSPLIDLVWKSMQDALITTLDDPAHSSGLRLYSANVLMVLEHLLATEAERLRCVGVVTKAASHSQMQMVDQRVLIPNGSPATGSASASRSEERQSYIPSEAEEMMRLKLVANVVKFLFGQGSLSNTLNLENAAHASLLSSMVDACTRALRVATSPDAMSSSAKREAAKTARRCGVPEPAPRCGASYSARFSSRYYAKMNGVIQCLVKEVLECGVSSRSAIASRCIHSICFSDGHLSAFTVSEVLDTVTSVVGTKTDEGGDESASSNKLSALLDMLRVIIVPSHHGPRSSTSLEDLARYGQLLCDCYENALAAHMLRSKSSSSKNFPTTMMSVVSDRFWKLTLRVHQRLRSIARDVVRADLERLPSLMEALKKEQRTLEMLISGASRCMLNVAWPASSIISRSTSSEKAPTVAMRCLSPFFSPLRLLMQLRALFPITSVEALRDYITSAESLDEWGKHILSPRHFFTATHAEPELMDRKWVQNFRSCWLMWSYYRLTEVAMGILVNRAELKPKEGTASPVALTHPAASSIRVMAASAAPLLRMCSSDVYAVRSEIDALLRCTEDATFTKEGLRRSFYQLSGGKRAAEKLTQSELFLVRAIAELELLRASAGSIAPLALYSHFDVRDFVASGSIKKALTHIGSFASELYMTALRAQALSDAQFRLLERDIRELVFLAGFSLSSVRDTARRCLSTLANSFPISIRSMDGLPLLWELINLLQTASTTDIGHYCLRHHILCAQSISTLPSSDERQAHVAELVRAADDWVSSTSRSAPLPLFDVALRFIVQQRVLHADIAVHPLRGTSLAVSAAHAASSPKKRHDLRGVQAIGEAAVPNYAQTLMRFSAAYGFIFSSLHYASTAGIEASVVAELQGALDAASYSNGQWRVSSINRMLFSILSNKKCEVARDAEEPLVPMTVEELDSLLCRAVALMSSSRATISHSSRHQLLRLVGSCPLQLGDSAATKVALNSARWLISNGTELDAMGLFLQVVEGVEYTIAHRQGLFDGAPCTVSEVVQTGCSGPEVDRAYAQASPHRLLFAFLGDVFVDSTAVISYNPVILLGLYQLASRMVECPEALSLKDASFSEMMRAMVLVGQICLNLHTANARRVREKSPLLLPFTCIGTLRQKWYYCLLRWFSRPLSWCVDALSEVVEGEMQVLESLLNILTKERVALGKVSSGFLDFSAGTQAQHTNIWGMASAVREDLAAIGGGANREAAIERVMSREQKRVHDLVGLLEQLVHHELVRLMVWRAPRRTESIKVTFPTKGAWRQHVDAAARHHPGAMVALVRRFPESVELRALCCKQVVAFPERFAGEDDAVDLYLTEEVLEAGCPRLFLFRPCRVVQALRLLDSRYTKYTKVSAFAIRSLFSQESEHLTFYLPQLLQVLATDESGNIVSFLQRMSSKSTMFCHQLLWSLQTEGEGTSELAKRCTRLQQSIINNFSEAQRTFYKGEFDFTGLVTSISGELMQFDKPQRKAKLRARLRDAEFHTPMATQHIYLPTDPDFRITDVIPHTAGAMQSAAKCPILVQFKCTSREHEDTRPPTELAEEEHSSAVVKACIFKMGDDCRQDQISLQLVGLMKRIMGVIGLPSYLYPYRVVTTGADSGIIECVPHSMSRNEIGKLVETNVAEYFVQTFGHPESTPFRQARENFIKSMASYSIVSFILNIKDRHNGNIMVDSSGHVIHIDFGFLFDTSPGGDMNFESSPFKLTTEMVQLIGLDVGSSSRLAKSISKALIDEESYVYFKCLVIRSYLAVRQYAREICILVELMLRSGLPCFKPHQTIAHLAKRLSLDLSEADAAHFMRGRIHEARQNYRTTLYDLFQHVVEGIEM